MTKFVSTNNPTQTIYGGGIVSATLMNEGTVRCGRLLCRPVSGLFADNPLQEGYSLVAQIPRGASNISITELRHSANRLGECVCALLIGSNQSTN